MRLVSLAVTAAATLAAAAPAAAQSIQPGDAMDGSNCTLGWVFDGADGRTFFSTAAHCVDDGATVTVGSDETLGKIVLRGDPEDVTTDIALVEVAPGMVGRVSAELRGHAGFPATVTRDPAQRDMLQMSGWGTGWEVSAPTREKRQGALIGLENGGLSYRALLPATGGDSGGPIAHVDTSGALGLVKGVSCGTIGCGMWGPTVTAVEQLAASKGITVRLRSVGPRPAAPAPPPAPQDPEPAGKPSGSSPSGGGGAAPAPAPAPADRAAAGCADTVKPPASRTAVSLRRTGLKLRGRAADTGCGSKLVRVQVTVRAARGGKARRYRITGGDPRFTLAPRVRLRPGRYTIVVRAVDAAGNATQLRRTARVR